MNETMVWDSVPIDDLEGQALYTLILISRLSGEVLLNRSYKAWSFHEYHSAVDIARDLTSCDDEACVLFVKWGARSKEQSDVVSAESTIWREAGSEKYLGAYDEDAAVQGEDSAEDEEELYASFEAPSELSKPLHRKDLVFTRTNCPCR